MASQWKGEPGVIRQGRRDGKDLGTGDQPPIGEVHSHLGGALHGIALVAEFISPQESVRFQFFWEC